MSLPAPVAAVRSAVRTVLPPSGTVLVACSGGADSLALASAAIFEGHRAGVRVLGVTVDHGLQEDSAARATAVVAQLAVLGADETMTARVSVDAAGLGMEAAARHARYAVLEEVAQRTAGVVLLGHTLDDQAETVLLGLARGSGGRSIAGMRPAFGPFRRPLLALTRAVTVAACEAEGLDFWADPHNADPRFTRARVRGTVLPTLEAELGPGVAEALARTAGSLRPDMEYLDALADAALAADPHLSVAGLVALPDPVRTRVLRLAAVRAGAVDSELFRVHVLALDDLLRGPGGRTVQLPGHLSARRLDGRLVFTPTSR